MKLSEEEHKTVERLKEDPLFREVHRRLLKLNHEGVVGAFAGMLLESTPSREDVLKLVRRLETLENEA